MTADHDSAVRTLENIFAASCNQFSQSITTLNYPGGTGKNSIFHENNLIIHIAHALMERGFHCYAEAAVGGGRIDLVASDKNLALAIEAKMFGDPRDRVRGIKSDLRRMQTFAPTNRIDAGGGSSQSDWWSAARERWGVIAIGHQRAGATIIERAWKTDSHKEASELIQSGNAGRHRAATITGIRDSFIELRQALRSEGLKANLGAHKIFDGNESGSADGAWLLWAAFRLRGPAT